MPRLRSGTTLEMRSNPRPRSGRRTSSPSDGDEDIAPGEDLALGQRAVGGKHLGDQALALVVTQFLGSDHGSQFTSWAFTENVRRLGLISSMGTVGDCYDNAPMESFWGSMQIELLNRDRWRTNIELAVGHSRLHRALLQLGPPPQRAGLPHAEPVRG